mgnify:CR=1 FL=1
MCGLVVLLVQFNYSILNLQNNCNQSFSSLLYHCILNRPDSLCTPPPSPNHIFRLQCYKYACKIRGITILVHLVLNKSEGNL